MAGAGSTARPDRAEGVDDAERRRRARGFLVRSGRVPSKVGSPAAPHQVSANYVPSAWASVAQRCSVHGHWNRPVCPPVEQTRHRPVPSLVCWANSRCAMPGWDRINLTNGSTVPSTVPSTVVVRGGLAMQ